MILPIVVKVSGNVPLNGMIDRRGLACHHWLRNAEATPDKEAVVHWMADHPPYRWKWGKLIETAWSFAFLLQELGVEKGDVCALIVRHNYLFYPLYIGVCLRGAVPSVLAYPNSRLHPEKFRDGLLGMSRRSGLDFILTERDLETMVTPLVTVTGSSIKAILYPLDSLKAGEQREDNRDYVPVGARTDEPCLLQHSSGTTGLQKPVVLSHRAVLEHVDRYGIALGLTNQDRIVSWLPLYHDMGLIAAFYLPLICGIPLIQLNPFDWVMSPVMLLEAMSQEQGTMCWLPNFAYNLMADRIREEDLKGIRLDTLRMLINCSEPIRSESHDKFYRRFAPYGLRKECLSTCYAMAETTFAVTQTAPNAAATGLIVDRAELSKGNVSPVRDGHVARVCVSSGKPISGCALRIVDEHRRDVPYGQVGEIAISSASLFEGYRNYPEKTREVLEDSWYYSGDLGFVHNGECFVIGRRKDLIIIAGNNIYPEDVEDAVGKVPGVIAGRVVAFGMEDDATGTEALCVVAETEAATAAERRSIKVRILKTAMELDLTISRVFFAPPRWLIKSSSGKPARAQNMARAISDLNWS